MRTVLCVFFFSAVVKARGAGSAFLLGPSLSPRVHHRCLRVLAISPIAIGHGAVAD